MESSTEFSFIFLSLKRIKEDPDDSTQSPCRKKRKEDPDDPNQSSSYGYDEFINKLPDSLLLEILYRLPCQCAHRFKSVSKRWFSLISHPHFIHRFIHHRHQLIPKYSSDSQPFTLGFQYDFSRLRDELQDIMLDSFINSKISWSPFRIVATFNDLLLLRSNFYEYHIYNPLLTKNNLFSLPRLPVNSYSNSNSSNEPLFLDGFICHPSSCDKDYGCFTNAHYRYKVVRIHSPIESNTCQLHMDIFSSETGEWSHSIVSVSSPRGLNPFEVLSVLIGVVACNGKLYWVIQEVENNLVTRLEFMVFDPFDDKEQCRYIPPPIDLNPQPFFSIGVVQGCLRIFEICKNRRKFDLSFSVWELKEDAGTWSRKHKFYLMDIISRYPRIFKILANNFYLDFLAFHPNDGETVFLHFSNYIFLYNMRTGKLTEGGALPYKFNIKDHQYTVSKFARSVFLHFQPSWPTPVRPLPLKF